MSDWLTIALTAATTLLGGVILLILSKAIESLVVTPLQHYKKRVAVAEEQVDYWAGYLTNYFSSDPNEIELEEIRKIRHELRSAATSLRASYKSIAFRPLLSRIRVIPSSEKLDTVFGSLIGLSNTQPTVDRDKLRDPSQSLIDLNNAKIEEIHSILG